MMLLTRDYHYYRHTVHRHTSYMSQVHKVTRGHLPRQRPGQDTSVERPSGDRRPTDVRWTFVGRQTDIRWMSIGRLLDVRRTFVRRTSAPLAAKALAASAASLWADIMKGVDWCPVK